MRISLLTLCCYILVSCGAVEDRYHIDESSQARTENSVGIAFHSSTGWASVVPFYVDSEAPDRIIEASSAAAETWNDAAGHEVLSFMGIIESDRGSDLYGSLDDLDTVIYYEESWLDTTGKAASTLATTVWENAPNSDEIVKADIIMNAEIYLFQDSTVAAEDLAKADYIVDSETVLLHEFGHLLGLDHVSVDNDEDSIMHAKTFIGPYMYTRELSDDDIGNIQELYN